MVALVCEVALTVGARLLAVDGNPLPRLLSQGPFAYWYSWAIGAWIAEEYIKNGRVKWPILVSPAVCLLLVLATWLYRPLSPLAFTSVALLTASWIAIRLNKSYGESSIGNSPNLIVGGFKRFLKFSGMISYSLYLLHQPIISLVHQILAMHWLYAGLSPLPQYGLLFCISLLFAIFISWIFYQTVELTSILMGNKLRTYKVPWGKSGRTS